MKARSARRDDATLQESVTERGAPSESDEAPGIGDPVGLFRHLERTGRFHRDRGLGRIYHVGALSLRENVPTNSLHVSIEGNRVSAHVDKVSPLGTHRRRDTSRYKLARVALHNVTGMAADFARALRGRQGDHRCELECEWMVDGDTRQATKREKRKLIDPAESPWSVHLEARVTGRLDVERLRDAFRTATPGPDRLSVVDCPDDVSLAEARAELQVQAVPLTDPLPFLARLAHHPDGDVVMLNVNHAAADALGALQVLSAVARAYAGQADDEPPIDFLATRDLPVRPAPAGFRTVVQLYRAVTTKVRDVLTGATRLLPDQPRDEPGHSFHLVSVDADDPASLRLRDRDTDNDVLLAALHRAVAAWNAEHGHRDGRNAVLVPIDLRFRDWPSHVVGNFSVTARVSTRPGDRADPAATLRSVTAQTARNIRTRTGTALIDALARHNLLALWAKQSEIVLHPLTANHLVDSALLAYVGRLDEPPVFGPDAGDTTEVWLSTPARMPHGLSVGAVTVGDCLHLVFRYPNRLFGPDAVRRFAQSYLAQLRLVAHTPLPER